jgi:hypothetical protein
MTIERLINEITGSTSEWNTELSRLIHNNNDYINLTYRGLFTEDSPFLQIKLSDSQIKRLIRKNNKVKWQDKL